MNPHPNSEDTTMNTRFNPTLLRTLAACALAACMGSATAQTHYYDGGQARTVSLQPDLRAEFTRGDNPRARQALAATGAVPLSGVGDALVRIYRLPATAERASAAAAPAAGSPVYREGNSPAGRLMALPGGVMVKFKPDWSRAQIDAFVAARGLTVERKLAMDGNWFLLATPAGQASLTTANALFETGELLVSTPNWWKHTVSR